MNNSPLISVIVITYNRKELLKETIDSIINQTYKNFELIIVDNYSDYDFFSYIKSFNDDRIKPYQNQNNGIIAVNRNYGIKKAKGEYIAFCDDDDLWKPKKLLVSLDYMEKYSADIVYHDLYYKNNKGKLKLFNNKTKTREFNKPVKNDLLYNGNGINNSSVVIKKDVLLNVGLITEDKNKISWEDYHTWIKIAENNYIFKQIPICLGYYRIGNQKKSCDSQIFKNFNNIRLYYSEFIGNRDLWWIHYIKSKVYFNSKDYKSTIAELKKINYNLISVSVRLKIYYIIFYSRIRSLFFDFKSI